MATQNSGRQGYFVLQQIDLTTGQPTGFIKPNIPNNSPQALIPVPSSVIYSYPDDQTPIGGADGDIWYNPVADQLFKRIATVWTLLTDRVADDDFVPTTINDVTCPTPSGAFKNIYIYAMFGITITGVINGTGSGMPPDMATLNIVPGQTYTDTHTGLNPGTYQVKYTGVGQFKNRVRMRITLNGSTIFLSGAITGGLMIFSIVGGAAPSATLFITIETF